MSIRITSNHETKEVNGAHPDAVLRHLRDVTAARLKAKRQELERFENTVIAVKVEVETLVETLARFDQALAVVPATEPSRPEKRTDPAIAA